MRTRTYPFRSTVLAVLSLMAPGLGLAAGDAGLPLGPAAQQAEPVPAEAAAAATEKPRKPAGDEAAPTDTIEVIGVTPVHGVGLAREKVPTNVQSATPKDIDRSKPIDLTSFMERNLSNVTLNAAQGNPLQPDLNYRGFSASPLLGLPQGLSVFVNGVRYNDPLGDTVNWDLLPSTMVKSMNVIGGSNPLFGLNTLGGAISIETKNGFNSPGHWAEAFGGSYGRSVATLETGGNDGTFGYFLNVRNFNETGWRDDSPSEALNIFSSVGWRGDRSSLDLSALYGNSDLTGNGPVPVQLLDVDRTAFFTAPDVTKNQMTFLTLEGTHWFTDKLQLSGNAFYRNVGTQSFNGDDSPLVSCTESGRLFSGGRYPAYPLFNNNPSFWGFLANNGIERDREEPGECPEDIGKLANTGALAGQVVTDQNGQPIGFDDEDAPYNAVNNRSHRRQQSFGTTQQLTVSYDVFGFKNQFIAGWAYNRGLVNFNSSLEVGYLRPNRVTQGLGYFIPEDATVMNGSTTTWSGFFNDAIDLTDSITLTFGGRYNSTTVTNKDDLGNAPELNAKHTYSRFNPAAGLTWQALKWLNLYGSYSESARAPTIIELACSDPDAACRLPNAFLADPPLKQVVAETFEAGARGSVGKALNWNLGFYNTLNRDDIIFQSTGGATANIGYFANVGSTRRLGVEAGLEGLVFEDWRWYTNYGFIDATFQSNFTVSSPNNPYSTPSFGPNNAYTNSLEVRKGDRIPGIPAHNFKFGLEVPFLKQWMVGGQGIFNSGQYLRGDEANQLGQTDAWFVLNLYGSFKFNQHVTAFATLQNVTNTKYNTFGILGEANELPGFQNYTNPRFLGPAPPFGGWAGIRITL